MDERLPALNARTPRRARAGHDTRKFDRASAISRMRAIAHALSKRSFRH
jgi:hypothetical protein